MQTVDVLLYLHILGATVWVGGLIVVGALVPAIRGVTDDRAVIRAVARRFGIVSWIALAVQVVTGSLLLFDHVWSTTLSVKISLVMLSAILAAWHSLAARDQSPAVRGAIQGVIMLLALAIVWLAIQV
jgi:putative copper export protein